MILGGTSGISQFYEHGFYDWVIFCDEPIQYPDENPMLGIYLVPEIDVSPSMTAKIMKANVKLVHLSKYRGLKEDEKYNQVHVSLRKDFNNMIRELFGPDISPDDFSDVHLEDTPLYEKYKDDTMDAKGCLAYKSKDGEVPVMATGLYRQVQTPEVNENYVNSSVMLPRGNTYSRWKFIGSKRDASGNDVGNMTTTPYLTRANILLSLMMGRSENCRKF